ncbi:hypothetical protein PFUGPA_05760 [Plasmodium falciparum Palo Alto/Uganda]|uniref:DNA replication complex GINS protein, putative n=5 Tax=Plasmodium falciparum TaxID=5833 RepID=O77383_PLAF7|nr:DNA replication complex GINS protein, putative [Plasmodium falciparum 3D7]ETW38668.1 hypothetical protein PFTANZ_00620 [Plasmodium falciparum Tanzania (2000708)]ETW52145.1 hypothetical protein PFUGPA_05760 [Plasmodium falciparum Palo Alto/Uganda]ETW63496.1 hypothetical protein PFMC_00555 [Plasmodium falciparum CAMP/Malaysia]KAF4328868.1 DNA replication complex GINS protein [Plasmodium falciparum NF54]PKC45436.1 DNA replication complex GINS protein [Plasmodium falciparum NF54]|eukprot:XP_001351244.1 conserved Plasmodium protein, unknown function [Plasmodium falciparum 3D7]
MSDVFSIFKKKRNKKTKLYKTSTNKGNTKRGILMNDKSRRKAYGTPSAKDSIYGEKNIKITNNSNNNNNNKNNNKISNNNKNNNISNNTNYHDLYDDDTINRNNQQEVNIVLENFPKLPIKNVELCEDIYNIFYIRDQYLIGNKNILINNDHIILLETILDKIENAINDMMHREDLYCTKKVLSSVHEKMLCLYNSFKNIKSMFPQLSNSYDCFKSNVIFIKAKQFKKNYVYDNLINIYTYLQDSEIQQDNIEVYNEILYINDKQISSPSFINKNMLTTNDYIEFLPMKFNTHFIELNKISVYYLYEESMNHIIWQKVLDELIVVKALADIPYFDLTEIEGFDFKKMKSGQRQWYPIYIAKELSDEGLATVEFPFWFYIDNLKHIYKKEFDDINELTDLPSPFFFEISSMFLENNCFKNSTPIETIGQRTPYKYILKVAGLIQDIRQKRIYKIMNKIKSCDIFSEILMINNIQIYETYCVNYLASVFFQKNTSTNSFDESFDIRNYLFDPFIFSSYNT